MASVRVLDIPRVLLDLVFPTTCAACGVYSRIQVCSSCESGLKPIPRPVCFRCGKPTRHEVRECRECRGRRLWFSRAVAVWEYTGSAKSLVKSVKYGNRRHLAREMADRMIGECAALGPFDSLTWVPMAGVKMRLRGYNQSELIARHLARMVGIPAEPLLRKSRYTKDQNQLDRLARYSNNREAFRLSRGADIAGKRVLIVDDVYTTGSTVADCARALASGGAEEILVLTAARTVKDA